MIAYNLIGSVSGDDSRLFRSMYRTVSGRFDRVWLFPIGLSDNGATDLRRNIVVLATDSATSKDELVARAENRVGGRVKVAGFSAFARDLYGGLVPVAVVTMAGARARLARTGQCAPG